MLSVRASWQHPVMKNIQEVTVEELLPKTLQQAIMDHFKGDLRLV